MRDGSRGSSARRDILPLRMTPATVLLIDANAEDEQLFREELALIRDRPFVLEVIRSLAEALLRMKQGVSDVILLDLHLPDSLGLTTFLRLQPKAGDQPIIVLVGQADEDLGSRRSSAVRSISSSNNRSSATC